MASVNIKVLHVDMQVKNRGVEFEVHDNDGNHKGDLIVNRRGLVWCKGKTSPENGERVTWEAFVKWMEE
jgi:hypothetical protein